MSMDFYKENCLKRAKKLLENKDDNTLLRYVCLELRFCIESITYDKLKTYLNRLPPSVIEKWQPPQAMKALLELEPLAAENFELFISPESSTGVPTGNWVCLGQHEIFKLSWLRKTYNKLGSFLHVPSLKQNNKVQRNEDEIIRNYLEKVVTELTPIVESTMDASFAQVVTFKCEKCGEPIIANSEGLKRRNLLECLNPNCRAEYEIQNKNGQLFIHLMTLNFKCAECGEAIYIENRELSIGLDLKCKSCGTCHEIISRQWCYQVKDHK